MFHLFAHSWIIRRVARSFKQERPPSRGCQPGCRPRVEYLEDRTLPAAGLAQLLTIPQDEFITGLYDSLLHRAPRPQEVIKLTESLASGQSRTDAMAKVLASTEYIKGHSGGWIPNLYHDVLGRSPDARGLANWRRGLKDGMSRAAIARGLLNGSESQSLMVTIYAEVANAGGPDFETQAALAPLLVKVKPGVANGLSRLTTITLTSGGAVEPTDIARLFRVNGSETALSQLAVSLPQRPFVKYVETEQAAHIDLAPGDPSYTNNTLWGLNGAQGIKAPTAWNTLTGSTRIVVADIDTGIDYNHPDLYKNIWVNQAEIPNSWFTRSGTSSAAYNRLVSRSQVRDIDSDGKITFWDLNDSANAGLVWDNNGDGRIDASDILRPRAQGGWEDGVDNSGDGYRDDLVGWNFVANNNKPFDDHSHGTHVAGTIGAIGDNGLGVVGVNWKTQIMALKWMYPTGDGRATGTYTSAASALRFAADNGARVSNNSWGGPYGNTTLRDAIVYAGTRGQVVVVAAGNEGQNISFTPSYPAAYHLPNMIVVAATDINGQLANFSNYSSTLVDVGAPGVDIYSTIPGGGYASYDGTSMATPHVVGIVALVLGAQPGLTMAQVIGQVVNNTTPLAALAGKTLTGGLVDVARALGSSSSPGVPATPGTPTWSPVSSSNGFVSWDSVSGAASYRVQYSSNGASWNQYTTVSSPLVYVQAGFYYRVAAVNSSGVGSYSSAVFASPQNISQPPATPGQPSWSSAGGNTINLFWNAVAGATSYQVQWWNSSTASWVTLGTYSGTSASINNGLGFYWQVAAINSAGMSNYSSYLLAGQAPSQPGWSGAGGTNIYLYWNNVGATSYLVQYWNSSTGNWVDLATYGGNVTSATLLYSYGYYWRVGAIYSTSNPVYSAYVLAR